MNPGISMVMAQGDEKLLVSDIVRVLANKKYNLPAATEISQEDTTLSFNVGAYPIIATRVAVPIPWGDLENLCETSILWKNARAEVQNHTHHYIVVVQGELNPVELSKLLTQVTAAFLEASRSTIGVYWSNAPLIVPKKLFIDFTDKVLPEELPLPIWVDFRVGWETETTSSGFTVGMTTLGHMEFEVPSALEPPAELHERLMNLAAYVLESGAVIKDGHSVGKDAKERIRVRYSPSFIGRTETVMRLIYEAPASEKPWWKWWQR